MKQALYIYFLILREFYYDKEIFLDDVTTINEDNLVEIY